MRGRFGKIAGVLLFYLVATAAATWPQAARLNSGLLDIWDAKLNAWIFHWDFYQTFRDPLHLFHGNIFHPAHWTLAFSENLYGAAIFGFPLFWAGASSLLVYNVLFLLGMLLSGLAGWALAREVTGDDAASLLSGVVFAFAPWKIAQAPHVQFQWSAFLALALLFLLRWLDHGRRRDLYLFGGFLLWNALTNVHYAVFAAFLVGLVLAWEAIVRGQPASRRGLLGALAACAVVGLLALPFYLPYREASKLYGMKRGLGEVAHFSGKPRDFFTAGPQNKLYAPLTQKWGRAEGDFFPGLVAVALAAGGLALLSRGRRRAQRAEPASPRRRAIARGLDLLLAGGALLYIAAVVWGDLTIAGVRLHDQSRILFVLTGPLLLRLWLAFPSASPYRDLKDFLRRMRVPSRPGLFVAIGLMGIVIALGANTPYWRFLARLGSIFGAIRVPARGIVLFLLALGVLASWGLSLATRSLSRPRRIAAISGALLLTAFEYRAAPMFLYPVEAQAPAVYRWLARAPFSGAVVELPLGIDPDFEYVFRSSVHNRPLVNGYSGFHPPAYREIAQLFEEKPIPDSVWDKIEAAGATIVVFHPKGLADNIARVDLARFVLRAVEAGRLRPLAVFPGGESADLVFSLGSAPRAAAAAAQGSPIAAEKAVRDLQNELDRLAPPFGVLDWPREGEAVAAGSPGWGWALDDSGIAEVAVLVAGREVLSPRGPRPDLPPELAKYPDSGRAGFGFALPDLSPGRYELEVFLTANDGGTTTLRRSIQIGQGRSPAGEVASHARPFGVLDLPLPGQTVEPGSPGWGWALDDSGIAEVVVRVAGRRIAAHRGPRPDLPRDLAKYPDSARAGFGFSVPSLPPGRYQLEIEWRAHDGGVTTLRRSFRIRDPIPSPGGASTP